MTRLERLALLVVLGLLLAGLVGLAPAVGGAGAAGGAVLGLLVSGRLRRLASRMDAVVGPDAAGEVRTGFRPRRVLVRVVLQLAVLGALLVGLGLLPFVGDELFAGAGAFATALPATLTAARLRRRAS